MTLKEYRKKAGYSQAKLAQEINCSIQTIQRIEQDIDKIWTTKLETVYALYVTLENNFFRKDLNSWLHEIGAGKCRVNETKKEERY